MLGRTPLLEGYRTMKNLKKWLFMTLIIFTMTISAIAVPVLPKPAERKVQAVANNIVFGDPNLAVSARRRL